MQHKMKMIGHDGIAEQVNSEVGSLHAQLPFQPQLAVVEVFSRQRIVTQEKTPADGSIHDMHAGDFIW